jgi:hypothetical protein
MHDLRRISFEAAGRESSQVSKESQAPAQLPGGQAPDFTGQAIQSEKEHLWHQPKTS